jgi:hypothetical protein
MHVITAQNGTGRKRYSGSKFWKHIWFLQLVAEKRGRYEIVRRCIVFRQQPNTSEW